ncbi:caspase family protein [Clostridium intestinale]|uniref:Peptidase C13 family protein n=1 Tax=Clostridium intestinale URNW TaxID=1294142 RepID=U2Q553_9CLOT|nr:caspase family protein [Clostridium intestinale]ERK31254.1 Peptidase C13 family protein [Clostridium intestinale URNW]
MGNYALLFAGCYNEKNLYIRYSRDIAYMYEVLRDKYNYSTDNIEILYSDGRSILYNGYTYYTKPACRNDIINQLNHYINKLSESDKLLIMITNHGGLEITSVGKKASIYTWDQNYLLQTEFAQLVSQIRAKKIILFGQCYGGNFLDENIPNSIIMSANFKDMLSYSLNDLTYDEFLFHFISYFNGSYPGNLSLNSSNDDLSLQAAFNYAKNNDSKRNPINVRGKIIYSVPLIKFCDCDPRLETI